MTTRKYSSRSQQTTLTGALTSSGTSATVVSGTALLGGVTISAGETFTVVIDPDTALEEIVDVTAVSTNTLTITRGVDGSTGQAHSAGAVVRHMAIGRDYREANQHIENTTTAHGLTIANVLETTDTDMITTAMLQSSSVTTAKISNSNVTTAKIADSAVTSAKIADATIATSNIADAAITGVKIATGAVGTAKIDDAAVTEAKIGTSAVTAGKIASDAVTTAKIQDSAVTSAKIANDTIVNADINTAAAIDSTKISGTAVTQADTGTVTSTMIANGTIVNADINSGAAIAKTKLDLGGTITSADLVDGTIVAADIADGTITAAKMVTDPYARANHTGTQAASTISDFNTAVRTNRLDQMATPTASVAMGSQKITGLADPTSAQDAVTIAYITAQKGATSGLASLDSNGLIPQSQIPGIALHTTTVVNSQSAMLAITGADAGDIAVRTDVNKTFVLTASPASTLGNWQELLTPTDSVTSVDSQTGAVSLSGTYLAKAGGTMTGDLTLAGAPSSNLHAATKAYVDAVAGSATAAAASAAAAASSYDSFDDRYLGAKSTAPSVDNDGNALIEGAIYWNSVDNAMYAWTGSEWGSISSTAAIYRFRFTASGGETTISGLDDNGLTLSYIPGKEQVYLNGILLVRTTDYTASNGSSLTSLAALAASDIVEVITFTSFEMADAVPLATFDAKGDILVGTAADTVGKLAVGTNGYVLKANSSTATGLEWGAYDPLPSQTSNSGKYLTTNGSTTSWGTVAQYSLPSQSGNAGKFLTTNGSSESWAAVAAADTIMVIMGAY